MKANKKLEKIFKDTDESGGRQMMFVLSDNDFMDIKQLFQELEAKIESQQIALKNLRK